MKNWYLIAYDIREPRRLKRLHYRLRKHALAVQYSVFVIHATTDELQQVEQMISENCEPQDDVRLYATGAPLNYWASAKQAEALQSLYTAQTHHRQPPHPQPRPGLIDKLGRLLTRSLR